MLSWDDMLQSLQDKRGLIIQNLVCQERGLKLDSRFNRVPINITNMEKYDLSSLYPVNKDAAIAVSKQQ